MYAKVLEPVLSCIICICPDCPATAFDGAASVLLPPSVTTKLFPSAKSITILVASVNVVGTLNALADAATFREPASTTKSPLTVVLAVTELLTYLASAIDTSGTFVVPVPTSAEAAVPKPKPFVFVANTLVPSQITKPTEPKGISYP